MPNHYPTDPADLQNQKVAIMAELGFHTRAIADATGFSPGQINSRTSLYGIRRRDYRDGINLAAGKVLALALDRTLPQKSRIFQSTEVKAMADSYDETRIKVRKRIAERAAVRRKTQKKKK